MRVHQVQFDAEELDQIVKFKRRVEGEFGINLRELVSAVFESLIWAPF